MLSSSFRRSLSVHRYALAVAVAVMIPLVGASTAAATPTGEYSVFKQCPLSVSGVVSCIFATTTGGEVKIGSTTVPITNPIVLQGGLKQSGFETPFVAAADGNTLSKVAQTVPGGLLGIVAPEFFPPILRAIFNEIINHGPTGVTATTELVGPAQYNFFSLLIGEGPGVVLPVRVKLGNAFLGNSCYIGSSSHPVTLNLTTGTTAPPGPNTPITGDLGTIRATSWSIMLGQHLKQAVVVGSRGKSWSTSLWI